MRTNKLLFIIRALIILLSLLGLGIFGLPISSRICNVGNIFGLAVSFAVFMFTILSGKIMPLLKHMWAGQVGKTFLISVICILSIGACYMLGASGFMIHAMNDKPENNTNVIIILGCKVRGEVPSLMLKRRILAAYNYLSENKDVIAVASGGKGNGEDISEAECMKRELIKLGIDENRILTEDKSTSTRENISFSIDVLKENCIDTINAAIVTDGFHQFRARLIAKNVGLDVAGSVSADTPWWLTPTYWVREWFGIAYQVIL